jgi:hypothetical protein
MRKMRRSLGMTDGISAIQANTNVLTASAGASRTAAYSTTSAASTAAASKTQAPEDTVQLSDPVQQYLQASQSDEAKTRGLVEQLVQAAATGDTGALSLLTVI